MRDDNRSITLGDVIAVGIICLVMIALLLTCQCSSVVSPSVEEPWPADTALILDSSQVGVCFLCVDQGGGYMEVVTGYECSALADLHADTWICVWAPFTDTLGPNQ